MISLQRETELFVSLRKDNTWSYNDRGSVDRVDSHEDEITLCRSINSNSALHPNAPGWPPCCPPRLLPEGSAGCPNPDGGRSMR